MTPAQGTTLNLGKATPESLQTFAFASTIRPVTFGTTDPNLAANTGTPQLYPVGTLFKNTNNPQVPVFKQVTLVGGVRTWGPAVFGSDIVAKTISAIQISAGAISALEMVASEILVGNATNTPTKFRVDDSSTHMIAFIGNINTGEAANGLTLTGAGFKGAYFLNVRIGTDINNPAIFASQSGVTIQNAPLTISTVMTNGILATTNSVETIINNQFNSTLGLTFGLLCQVTGGTGAKVGIAPTHMFFLGAGNTSRVTIDGSSPQILIYDISTGSPRQCIKLAAPGGTGQSSVVQVMNTGGGVETGVQAASIRYSFQGSDFTLRFVAGVMVQNFRSGDAAEDPAVALLRQRVDALEKMLTIFKGRNN